MKWVSSHTSCKKIRESFLLNPWKVTLLLKTLLQISSMVSSRGIFVNRGWVTMSYKWKWNTQKRPSVGFPWCGKCIFCPYSGPLSLFPHQASVNRCPRQNHRQVTEASCLCKYKVTERLWHWRFFLYLELALASNSTLTGGVSATLDQCTLVTDSRRHSLEN